MAQKADLAALLALLQNGQSQQPQQGWATPPRPTVPYAQGYSEGTNYMSQSPLGGRIGAAVTGFGDGLFKGLPSGLDALLSADPEGTTQHNSGVSDAFYDQHPTDYYAARAPGTALLGAGAVKGALGVGQALARRPWPR
jgi:hypothetical protein